MNGGPQLGLFRFTCINPQNYQDFIIRNITRCWKRPDFAVIHEGRVVDEVCLRSLLSMRLAEKFQEFAPQELATAPNSLLARS